MFTLRYFWIFHLFEKQAFVFQSLHNEKWTLAVKNSKRLFDNSKTDKVEIKGALNRVKMALEIFLKLY